MTSNPPSNNPSSNPSAPTPLPDEALDTVSGGALAKSDPKSGPAGKTAPAATGFADHDNDGDGFTKS